jgi:hypothetical protein
MKPTRVAIRLSRADEAVNDSEMTQYKSCRHLREVGILVESLVVECSIAIRDNQRSSANRQQQKHLQYVNPSCFAIQ